MRRILPRIAVSGAIFCALACSLSAQAAPTASSAVGFRAAFSADGLSAGVGPIGSLSGSAPPGYAKTIVVGPIEKSLPIRVGARPVPTMAITIASIRSHVASAGISIDTASAAADATVRGLDLSLMLNPPPPGVTVFPKPFLHVTAARIDSAATMSQIFPQTAQASSTARFSRLNISGSLIGNQPITLTGDVPNNTVLFQSDTVTITLNQKLVAGLIRCTPTCTFSPVSLTGEAIDIALNNAILDGKAVSGDITVGRSQIGDRLATALVATTASDR